MNKFKEILNNKKLVTTMIGAVVGILILLVIVFLIFKIMNRKMSYSELENELYFATQKYLKDHDAYYPTEENPETTITDTDLVQGKYIKDLNKLIQDSCSSEISVTYRNGDYQIRPFLSCDHYESQLFFDKILKDNPVTTSGNGLYDLNEMLTFRGDKVHNYVSFNNMMWRIVKMDPTNSTVYLILDNLKDSTNDIWDNRYNTSEESKHGINDFSVSVILDTLDEIAQTKFSNNMSRMVPMNICIGKRVESESKNDGSVECSNVMEKQKYVSLLPLYDYLNASTDHRCTTSEDRACSNYNYLVSKVGKWWTLTADGAKGTKVFGINYTGVITSDYADSKKYVRYMIALDGTNLYQEGNGESATPYIMK